MEMMEKGEVDRISVLPDCLIIEILSRLPSTKEAIRTGTLSKRWKHLWTSVHTLIFTRSNDFPLIKRRQNPSSMSDFISFVDKTLTQCRQLKLKKFEVCSGYDTEFESHFNNWIHYAISCNVEEVIIFSSYSSECKYPLDQSFFINTYFSDLTFSSCIFNPIGGISWKNLRRLRIFNGELDEDLIENILSGSPVLETLLLCDCYGFRRLDITSKSVKNLVFSGYYDPEDEYDEPDDIIEINAPNILSLKIQGDLSLWKLLLANVSSVVEAYLDCHILGHFETPDEEAEEVMLEGFILNLRHVKELEIGFSSAEAASRLEAKGFVFPSNIKFPCDWFDRDSDSAESGDGEVL